MMRHGVSWKLRANARVTIEVWSRCSVSMSAPTCFQNCCSTWPLARPRGVAVTSILNATGLPYSWMSCRAFAGSYGSAPSSLHLTQEPSPYGLVAGFERPLVMTWDHLGRSSAITRAWRTRASSNGATLVLKAYTVAPDPV